MPVDLFDKLATQCRSDARLVIHDRQLWAEYEQEANATYQARKASFTETERNAAEYAPGFQQRYGAELSEAPETKDGEVVRQDLFIMKGDTTVAQYVNYYARSDAAGSTIKTCLGSFPELYSDRKIGR